MAGSQPPPFLDSEMQRRAAQPQSSMLPIHVDLQARQQKEPWMAKLPALPVQWKVDGGEVMPVPSPQQPHVASQHTRFDNPTMSGLHHQRGPSWAESPLISQSGLSATHSLDSSHVKEGVGSGVGSLTTAVPKKSSPLDAIEIEQHRQPMLVTWSGTHTSTVVAAAGSLQHEFSPTFIDGAALWSIRPALLPQNSSKKPGQEPQMPRWQGVSVSTPKEPSISIKKEENRVWDMSNPQVTPSTVSQPEKPQKQWASGLAGASTSAQIDQSSAMSVSTSASHGAGSTLWDPQTPAGAPKTRNSPEKPASNSDFQLQQKQVSSSWAGAQGQTAATQKVPISIQYEPHRFGQGMGAPVWGVGPQTLLAGQLKPGNGAQELQKQPMVTGTQIIINQPSPFFSPPLAPLPPLALPGPHPLHSVAVGALPRPPHPNIFFTPQAVMSERPHMPQTLPLPQLAPRTEPHKLGPRLPFPPERLLQCMICGCSLPRELDLQMHYLQHAQGEI